MMTLAPGLLLSCLTYPVHDYTSIHRTCMTASTAYLYIS